MKNRPSTTDKDRQYTFNGVVVTIDTPIEYVPNKKRPNTDAYERYEEYSSAKTIGEYFEKNTSDYVFLDLRHDMKKDFVKVG